MTTGRALLTDLYQLTMAAAYFRTGFKDRASFELFVRSLPENRSFLIVAGLDSALEYLEELRFAPDEVDFLRAHPAFKHVPEEFFNYLTEFRFTGEVWAMPEGTVAFAEEPLLRVTAPILEAQVVETYLLSVINYQTLVASKAARLVEVAGSRGIVEFGTRRAHGPQAGVLAGRAAYIGGCIGTSNVLAGFRYGIPTYGTLAHSWIMAFENEEESFLEFVKSFPEHAILLIDTYDPVVALEKIKRLGAHPRGIRLDSGDLVAKSKQVRKELDAAGLEDVQIVASGDLNEYLVREMLAQGAPIDTFGVGTELATSRDAPALGGIYKLVELERHGEIRYCAKFSQNKITYPGQKQVFRFFGPDGRYHHDLIGRADESFPEARPLLVPVMRDGQRTSAAPPLDSIRESVLHELKRLPEGYRRLTDAETFPVRRSAALENLLEEVRQKYALVTPTSNSE